MKMTPWRWGAGALLTGIGLLVACDGGNLFDPNQNPFLEPRVAVSAPNGALAGDTIPISISATAASNVASIQVAIRGAANKDTTVTVTPARTVSATVKVGLPYILTDTLVYISAQAIDANGNASKVKADTVSVLGPPAIVSVKGPDSLKAGTSATITVHAFGSRKINEIAFAMRGALVKDTVILVSPTANDVTQSITITLPATVADTALRLGIVAKDITGLSSAAASVSLPLAITAPAAVLVSPIPVSVTPGANLDLSIQASAMRGLNKIGVVLTGAMSRDTFMQLNPTTQTSLTTQFSVKIPGDIQGTTLGVSAYAIDNAGTRSVASTVVNLAINTGLPVINSVTAPDSVRAGQIVDVRVVATGVRPITQLAIRFRGATNADQTVTILPAAINVTKDVQVQLPVDVSDTLLTITAVATDQAGQLSALTSSATKVVKVTDVTAPTVTATPNVSTTSAGGSFQIRVNARDNVALKQVGYAVVNPAGDTIGGTPTLATTVGAVKDTTFTFAVPATISPRTVRVLGIAVDASNRRGLSSAVNVIIADSTAPTITIIAPTLNATLPLNDSVRVQARVQDGTGIKTITMWGQSTRVDSLGPTRIIQRFAQKSITLNSPLSTDTTVTRYLLAIPDSISEPVQIMVEATDSLGNKSQQTLQILVGGPRVELRQPANNTQVVPGGTLSLQAFALDRAAGIDSVQVVFSGAYSATRKFTAGCPAPATSCIPSTGVTNHPDSVTINFDETIPALTPIGTITIATTAWNHNLIPGTATPVTVSVTPTAVGDTSRPQVRLTINANDRVELSDTITVDVGAQDVGSSGIRRMGLRITATPSGGAPAAANLYLDTLYAGSGRTGLQLKTFKFTLRNLGFTEVNLLTLPKGITFEIHAFAVDAIGNSGANVTSTLAVLQPDSVTLGAPPTASGLTKWYFAKNTTGATKFVTAVPGFGQPLAQGSVIADVLVDNNTLGHPRMFLANQNNNRVDVLELSDSTFSTTPISVGSEPWGLYMGSGADGVFGNADDRLIVANSGGTNISFVPSNVASHAALTEATGERLLTPNEVLFNVGIGTDGAFIRYTVTVLDFSDRPQFVAQDANGVVLYSTKPTVASPDGSIRYLTTTPVTPTTRPDSRILFNRDAIKSTVAGVALAYIDSVVVIRNTNADDQIILYDHDIGTPGTVRTSGPQSNVDAAVTVLRGFGSDVFEAAGAFDREAVGLSDTTYIATSSNHQFVGFGEGGVGPYARIWLWRCGPLTAACPIGSGTTGSISDNLTVQDLVGNASEKVVGLGLNQDGQVGAARGANYAYFFSNNAQLEGDLRLQGIFSNGVAGGGGGVALHPNHTTTAACGYNTTAFIATVNRSIKIVDTIHFRERGEIQIRDNIVGPLRAAIPLAADNAGIAGTADEILVKLYGVTGAGKADIINVRRRDMTGITGALPGTCL